MTDLGAGLGDQPDMAVAVAAVLANNSDVKMLLRVLGTTLQDSLGSRVEVRHPGGMLHRKSEEVEAIVVHLAQDDYEANLEGHAVRCVVGRSSGGIRIRNEQLPVEEWLRRLLEALQQEAAGNQAARQALENIVVGQ
ncbi:MAG: hypothetical protein ACYDEN_04625 [Acidimicrobiales bacterium]